MKQLPVVQESAAAWTLGWPGSGPFLITVEHASKKVPPPWSPTPADEVVLAQHWGWDIGIEALSRAMVAHTASSAVLARFSRLVCDANRAPEAPDLIVEEADGHPLSFNREVDAAARQARIRRFHQPYHQAIQELWSHPGTAAARPILLVMHSFTPVWRGERRSMEVGVIHTDDQGDLARRAVQAIAATGLVVARNEPYSTAEGKAWSLEHHGQRSGLPHLELEVNQALIAEPQGALSLGRTLAQALAPLHRP